MKRQKLYITYLLLLFQLILNWSCLSLLKPRKSFQASENLQMPDYSQERFWAALPNRKDSADEILKDSQFVDNQEKALADVFFIHPTTYLQGSTWNADLENKALNERTDNGTIKHQASVFNGCCKIYAPRYRQAVIYVFLKDSPEGEKALDMAYKDVENAFEYYMQNWNRGRPFILASHSQGTRHAVRLFKEKIANSAYNKKFVAGYLIGFPFSEKEIQYKICSSPKETNCILNWNSFLYGKKSDRLQSEFENSVCINPLSWEKNEISVQATQNPGSVNRHFNKLYPSLVDAKCSGGYLWINKPKMDGITALQGGDNYHVMDYAFYYASIRENAILRVQEHLKKN